MTKTEELANEMAAALIEKHGRFGVRLQMYKEEHQDGSILLCGTLHRPGKEPEYFAIHVERAEDFLTEDDFEAMEQLWPKPQETTNAE